MVIRLLDKKLPEGPFEAGAKYGLDILTVIKDYFKNDNNVIKLLRIYNKLSRAQVAEKIGVSRQQLAIIEDGDSVIDYKLVPRFANLFNVDLKLLLVILGHAKPEILQNKEDEHSKFTMAARYSGPELTDQEKVDLEKLFKMIVENMKER